MMTPGAARNAVNLDNQDEERHRMALPKMTTIPRKAAAAVAVLAFGSAGLVALAPTAGAATVSLTMVCRNPFAQEVTLTQDVTVAFTPETVAAGGTVNLAVTLGTVNYPFPIEVQNLAARASLSLSMRSRNEGPGPVTVVGPATVSTHRDGPISAGPFAASFAMPTERVGQVDFNVTGFKLDSDVGPIVDCTTTEGSNQTVGSVTVDDANEPAVLSAPPLVRPGGSAAVSGSHFTPLATPAAQLCRADESICLPLASSLSVDGDGALSGSVSIGADVPDGFYVLRVADTAKSASAPLEVKASVGPPRLISLYDSGSVGTRIMLYGTQFNPGKHITVQAVNAGGEGVGPVADVVSDGGGTFFVQDFRIDDATMVGIRATEQDDPSRTVTIPFRVTGGGSTSAVQSVSVGLTSGGLSLSQSGTGVSFGNVPITGEVQTLTGALNPLTVLDKRGGHMGWSLTATVTDLSSTTASNTIPAANLSWTPNCTASADSLSAVANGSAVPLGGVPALLCAQAADPVGATGGKFTANAALSLRIPSFAAAGDYTGTMLLTLI